MTNDAAISLRKITKQYGTRKILDECDLTVPPKTFTMIFGESGAGKSTLLNIISLTDKPSSGTYFIDGIQVDYAKEKILNKIRKEKIGIVFQMYHLIPHLTVKENILLPFLYRRIDYEAKLKRRLDEYLQEFGLSEKIDQPIELLSGGEKQRTAIIRAMIANPSVLICDEPTGNLDEKNTDSIMTGLKRIARQGTTIVMVSHNCRLIRYADYVYELKKGKLSVIKND